MSMKLDPLTDRALFLASLCDPIFDGEDPGAIGGALAELMSIFLIGHKIADANEQHALREEILRTWLEAVHELLALHERGGKGVQ